MTKQIQHRLSDAQIDQLIERYKAGETARALGSRFEVNRRTVLSILARREVPRRYNVLSPDLIQKAGELYQSGWSLARLGEQFDVDPSTVRRALLAAGFKTRPRASK